MNTSWYRWDADTLIINLYVQPRASKDQIDGLHGGALKVRITAPPTEGKANAHLLRYVARLFKVKSSQVKIVRGETGRSKTLAVHAPGVAPHALVPGDNL